LGFGGGICGGKGALGSLAEGDNRPHGGFGGVAVHQGHSALSFGLEKPASMCYDEIRILIASMSFSGEGISGRKVFLGASEIRRWRGLRLRQGKKVRRARDAYFQSAPRRGGMGAWREAACRRRAALGGRTEKFT